MQMLMVSTNRECVPALTPIMTICMWKNQNVSYEGLCTLLQSVDQSHPPNMFGPLELLSHALSIADGLKLQRAQWINEDPRADRTIVGILSMLEHCMVHSARKAYFFVKFVHMELQQQDESLAAYLQQPKLLNRWARSAPWLRDQVARMNPANGSNSSLDTTII
jgi:hypothetical protein